VKFETWQAAALLVAAALFGVTMFVAGTRCSSSPAPIEPPGDVDAGPGESQIAVRLDAAVQEELDRQRQIEDQYEADIAAFDEQQREKYEALQHQDLDSVVEYLRQWHEHRAHGG